MSDTNSTNNSNTMENRSPSIGGSSAANTGGSDAATGNRGSGTGGQPGRGRRNRGNRGGNRGPPNTRSKFKGKCEEIADFVYDTGITDDSKELFKNTTREIAEYISRNYEKAGEF